MFSSRHAARRSVSRLSASRHSCTDTSSSAFSAGFEKAPASVFAVAAAIFSSKTSFLSRTNAMRLNRISELAYFSMRSRITGHARASHSVSPHAPCAMGPRCKPSSSYSAPFFGT